MKGKTTIWIFFLLLTFILGACVPTTFSPPTEIHITDGDQVEQAVIAVDAAGRSHIAGVVADRIVYYRTRYGEPLTRFTMALGGSGTNWKQYNPDIAVLDNGMAYVAWVEQRGGPEKFACYQQIPLYPPIGGYAKDCDPLDGTEQTAGNVWVTARGSTAYAVYDRPYTTGGRTTELWYRRLSSTPTYAGRVAWFIENFETVQIFSLDLGIDDGGFLHVGYHYNWTTGTPPPYAERMEICSNRSTLADGQMNQIWIIVTSSYTDDVPVSLSFYNVGTTQHVALASVYHPSSVDLIYISSCAANGCGNKQDVQVDLPASWDTFSIIEDVEILGLDDYLYLSFIGDDNTSPTGVEQVYYMWDAFGSDLPLQPSSGSATWKYDLEMTRIEGRPGSGRDIFAMIAWGESNVSLNEF